MQDFRKPGRFHSCYRANHTSSDDEFSHEAGFLRVSVWRGAKQCVDDRREGLVLLSDFPDGDFLPRWVKITTDRGKFVPFHLKVVTDNFKVRGGDGRKKACRDSFLIVNQCQCFTPGRPLEAIHGHDPVGRRQILWLQGFNGNRLGAERNNK